MTGMPLDSEYYVERGLFPPPAEVGAPQFVQCSQPLHFGSKVYRPNGARIFLPRDAFDPPPELAALSRTPDRPRIARFPPGHRPPLIPARSGQCLSWSPC